MNGVRVSFILALSLALLPIPASKGPPLFDGPRAVVPMRPLDSVEGLTDRLRLQGRDPRRVLFWQGSPLMVERRDSIDLGGARFDVVALVQAFAFVPGDWVERYLLLDERGILRDAATLYWPLRRRFEIESTRGSGEPSEAYLEIRDYRLQSRPDTLALPYAELGVEPGRAKRVPLPWTGTRTLGTVWIEGGLFRAEPAGK
jgi:hypothetical protein